MKIGQLDTQALPAAPAQRKAATPVPAVDTGAQREPGTKVDLSSSLALRTGVSSEPTFDAAKVERIAQAIRDGKFEVNAGAIADKLIANAQELLGRSKALSASPDTS